MTKKLIAILMVVAMVPALLPCIAFAAEDDGGSAYRDKAQIAETKEAPEKAAKEAPKGTKKAAKETPEKAAKEAPKGTKEAAKEATKEVPEQETSDPAAAERSDAAERDDLSDSGEPGSEMAPAEGETPEEPAETGDPKGMSGSEEAEQPADTGEPGSETAPAEEKTPEEPAETGDPKGTSGSEEAEQPADTGEPGSETAPAEEKTPEEPAGSAGLEETGGSDPVVPVRPAVKIDPVKPAAETAAGASSRMGRARRAQGTAARSGQTSQADTAQADTAQAAPPAVRPAILENPGLLAEAYDITDLTVGLMKMVREKRSASGSWALIDLIAMFIASVISALMVGFWIVTSKGDEYDEEMGYTDNSLFVRALGVIPAASTVMIFFLTQDMSRQMRLADHYTGPMLLFLAAEILIAVVVRRTTAVAEPSKPGHRGL